MEMQISEEAQAALFALEDLGPFASPRAYTRLLNRLPPCSREARHLAGFLDGLNGRRSRHLSTLLEDGDFAAGYIAGIEIAAPHRREGREVHHV